MRRMRTDSEPSRQPWRGRQNWPAAARNLNPLSRFPQGEKPGREGIPPRREHAARQQKALARIDAAGSPHKRAAAPLCIPCVSTTECSDYRTMEVVAAGQIRLTQRNVYTKYLTLPAGLMVGRKNTGPPILLDPQPE